MECAVETDRPALIPDGYIDITAEKIRIYKDIDSMSSDKEAERYISRLADRFGPIPEELDNLFCVVKLRNLGSSLGFEKIIVKNGILIAFFISNPMSPYYKSKTFDALMARIVELQGRFELKQNENRLKIVARNVDSLQSAYSLMGKLR